VATIQLPLASTVIYKGIETVLQGKASDNDTGNGFPTDLPCSSLEWKSNTEGALGSGCDLGATFIKLGLQTLTLTATDANGAQDTTTVVINVKAVPTQGPPIVKILKPTQNLIVENAASNLYVTDKSFDPDGSTTLTRQWIIRYSNGFQDFEKTITLKKDRAGKEYFIPNNYISSTSALAAELELRVTDGQGEIGSDKVSIWVFYPPQ
jgi:hypothetical protein